MILITGGAGFIGSNLLAALADDHDVVVCDLLGNEQKWRNLAAHTLHDFISTDDVVWWTEENAEEITAIFHMGAISTTTETDADAIANNNFVLTRRLWDIACDYGIKFIYASSASVYGDGDKGFDDQAAPNFAPMHPYGWSKLAFDKFALKAKKAPPQWAGLRFFNVYGPNEYHKGGQQSVVAHVYNQVKAGAQAKLFKSYHPEYADGGQLRDFVYVDDVVDVMVWLLDNKDVSGIFNVGTGSTQSFLDLANAVFSALGLEPDIKYVDMPEGLAKQYQYYTKAEMSKLRAAGYTAPMTSLHDGVKDYVQNYLDKTDSYK